MTNISGFIAQVRSMGPNNSFQQFQDLPSLVQLGLVWGTKEQDAGKRCEPRDVMNWIIQHYNRNENLAIAELGDRLEKFVMNPVRCRMVRCYVDHGCDMIQAKLAWTADY